jgi:hypothetical protein
MYPDPTASYLDLLPPRHGLLPTRSFSLSVPTNPFKVAPIRRMLALGRNLDTGRELEKWRKQRQLKRDARKGRRRLDLHTSSKA